MTPEETFFGVAAFFVGLAVFADRLAIPPKAAELAGVWIGFANDELVFTRLDLRKDFTGYCACVCPADTSLHEFGVDVYRVTHWESQDWKFVISLTPVGTNAEGIYLNGSIGTWTLDLEMGGTNGNWKRKLVLRKESRIEAANRECSGKVQEIEKK